MLNCLSKYVCIFLLLALSGLFFLFRNINVLEWKLNCILDVCSIQSMGPILLDRKRCFCSGGPAEALVIVNEFQGRLKSHGEDVLLAELHSPQLGVGIAGQVLDHRNGTYSTIFPLLWEGSVQVEVTVVHSSEAVHVLRRLREERTDRVLYKSLFRSGLLSEATMCNLCRPTNQQPLGNYTDPCTGEPCPATKPKHLLSCDTWINHFRAGYKKDLITNKEALLFQRLVRGKK